jgi:hypothetical protein
MFSLTTRTALRAAAPRRAAPAAVRFVGGPGSTMHGNDPQVRPPAHCDALELRGPQVLEREKQKNLDGHEHNTGIHNAPGWNDRLASSSEAAIKVLPPPLPLVSDG